MASTEKRRVIAAAVAVIALLSESAGEYYYDEQTVKRLVLGSGGTSGNCDYCEEAAGLGWIDIDDVFEGPMGDEDEPPLHPNCDCALETKDVRVRVYV